MGGNKKKDRLSNSVNDNDDQKRLMKKGDAGMRNSMNDKNYKGHDYNVD